MNIQQEAFSYNSEASQSDSYIMSSPESNSCLPNFSDSSTSDSFSIIESTTNTKRVKSMFTKKEDNKLIKLVKEYGDHDWALIASFFNNRSRRQCRERWNKYLCPTLNLSPWTSEEDELLLKKYNKIGPKWALISKSFKNRTNINIKSRYIYLMRKMKKNKNSFDYNQESDYQQSMFISSLKCAKAPSNQRILNQQSFLKLSSVNNQMILNNSHCFVENSTKIKTLQNKDKNIMINPTESDNNSNGSSSLKPDSENSKTNKSIFSYDFELSDSSLENLDEKAENYWDDIFDDSFIFDF